MGVDFSVQACMFLCGWPGLEDVVGSFVVFLVACVFFGLFWRVALPFLVYPAVWPRLQVSCGNACTVFGIWSRAWFLVPAHECESEKKIQTVP